MAANQGRRRLAQDHAALRASLPPDYFFAGEPSDDLRGLSIHLVGPTSTPFESGVFLVTLRIPEAYPQEPPKANFHTRIFHPNVDDRTGDVCVETLKRDWSPKLSLKDVLSTIRCLLVFPNPDSSLNEEAGKMIQDGYEVFARHARMMTEVYARVPEHLMDLVEQTRGRKAEDEDEPPSTSPRKLVSSSSTNTTSKPTPSSVRRKSQPAKPSVTVIRKIKRATSPTSRASRGADSDSDGGDSGKENVLTRPRPISPNGIKRSREEELTAPGEENEKGVAAKDTSESSGRKSPKLKEDAGSSIGHAHADLSKPPKTKITAAPKKTAGKPSKKPGVKLGLKRF
ncbi:UBC-like protein [Wilcoxina mikolae CBS 423.85]|nr:UBC-like protein [Wilcoxina mikolae CBS 423.85]